MFTFVSLDFYLRGYLINILDANTEHECSVSQKKRNIYFHANFSLVIKIMFLGRKFYLQYSVYINLFLQYNLEKMYS